MDNINLKGKKIIVGVSGSISAYKATEIVRQCIKAGAQVKVVMTESAQQFITPLTLSTLSKNEVFIDFERKEGGLWNNHVALGIWGDLLLIAPASAQTMAKLANGLCDNLLMAVYLSARCPVIIAPAMDHDMWQHAATQRNLQQLQDDGVSIIPPEQGELASGIIGEGRLAAPENIVQRLSSFLKPPQLLAGKNILITAGPTYEAIDPVRFIGNRSSGKMGIALAEEAAKMGAKVQMVLGPSRLSPRNKTIEVERVQSAEQMLEATNRYFKNADWCIMAAAVADYTPVDVSDIKIKKKEDSFSIRLRRTTDILKQLGKKKKANQLLVGFALETNDERFHAKKKLKSKNLDFIVLNSLQDAGAGFGYDTNKIMIIDKNGGIKPFELKSKQAVALDILNFGLSYEQTHQKSAK